ncbi:glycosyltransferase family 39 protein [Snodgrassella sp. CFCC 13594]|uniref:ArnT family glycosyltransferase n=1 Tax=Snodgrassella sp. CFCC 13594 TaxID=1775559 RepID=UPI000AB855F7|nr:hypothetical protein [Snodgrassella sp. CFCC 13594]
MLTYTPKNPSPQPSGNARPWLLLLLAFVWLWPGVFARDLWSPTEPEILTTIEQWQPYAWTIPRLFDQVAWQVAPLYYWLGILSVHWLSPWLLDPYEAVRFVNALLMIIAFACVGGAARQFLGRRFGRIGVLVLLGCPGMLVPGHMMSSFPLLLCGCSLCWYGFSLSKSRVMMASLMLGGGWVVLSLSGSLLLPLAMMVLALGLLYHPLWQQRRYRLVVLTSLLWAWPLMAVWPLALYLSHPNVFVDWWQAHALAPFGGFAQWSMAFSLDYYLKNVLWFAFPAWPLAVWSAYKVRLFQYDWGVLAIAWLVLMLLLLSASPDQYQDWLLIILPPLAIIGSHQLEPCGAVLWRS